MQDSSINGTFSEQSMQGDSRGCCGGLFNNSGCGCDSEILFFIIIFLLLFTNFGCGCCNR